MRALLTVIVCVCVCVCCLHSFTRELGDLFLQLAHIVDTCKIVNAYARVGGYAGKSVDCACARVRGSPRRSRARPARRRRAKRVRRRCARKAYCSRVRPRRLLPTYLADRSIDRSDPAAAAVGGVRKITFSPCVSVRFSALRRSRRST